MIGTGQTLASDNVLLVADSGNVIVNGTIDASNPNGGAIALYGTAGVTVGSGALLKAAYVADDPSDPAYNQAVRLPFPASAEVLWRDDAIYDIIGVLGWNDSPVRPGHGSAIFLHVARSDYTPTDGCVALAPEHLRRVLAMGLTELVVRQ